MGALYLFTLYRVIHEEGSIFREEILSVIVGVKNSYKHVSDS
jgi:hypothetical protein